jgi:hypothetical protein
VTPDEREQIRAAARDVAATAPPLSPAQRDRLNAMFRDAMRVVTHRHEQDGEQR